MFKKLCSVWLVLCALLATTGCPPISGIAFLLPGEWAFELSSLPGNSLNLILLEGGMTQNPVGPGPFFAGTLTWMQNDEAFNMTQDLTGAQFVYTGTVFSKTYMEGTFIQTVGGSSSGSWTASFVP